MASDINAGDCRSDDSIASLDSCSLNKNSDDLFLTLSKGHTYDLLPPCEHISGDWDVVKSPTVNCNCFVASTTIPSSS
jgi:hypothetical protein